MFQINEIGVLDGHIRENREEVIFEEIEAGKKLSKQTYLRSLCYFPLGMPAGLDAAESYTT